MLTKCLVIHSKTLPWIDVIFSLSYSFPLKHWVPCSLLESRKTVLSELKDCFVALWPWAVAHGPLILSLPMICLILSLGMITNSKSNDIKGREAKYRVVWELIVGGLIQSRSPGKTFSENVMFKLTPKATVPNFLAPGTDLLWESNAWWSEVGLRWWC